MKQKKLKKIASELWQLENECQNNINISENMVKMMSLIESLSLPEIYQLDEIMEVSNCKIKNFLI